jgi:rhodanese-related sulfurtransferase
MRFKQIIIILILIAAFGTIVLFYALNNQEQASFNDTPEVQQVMYRKITAEEARQIMDNGDSYVLLDVRTASEFNESHIEGAILIPDYEIAGRAEVELPDKNVLILIYCRSGNRSANVADELVRMGYINVYDFGGILDWPFETIHS